MSKAKLLLIFSWFNIIFIIVSFKIWLVIFISLIFNPFVGVIIILGVLTPFVSIKNLSLIKIKLLTINGEKMVLPGDSQLTKNQAYYINLGIIANIATIGVIIMSIFTSLKTQ